MELKIQNSMPIPAFHEMPMTRVAGHEPTNAATSTSTSPFELIANDLAEVEEVLARALESPRSFVARLVAHLGHYRGKRLRPALLLLTAQAAGEVNSSHHVLGAVVELIHTATLVHDDVLDEALLRRHQPTIKAGWGNQSSILLGDMLFSRAFHLASTVGDAVACEVIGRSTNRVCEGELHQVTERGNLDLTEADYLDIIDGKTAELTACCCHLGALYAGAGNDVVHHLSRFGRNLGLAFQIADDLLDITGHEAATGKTLGTDLQQKKMTLPMIYMLSRLATDARKQVQRQLETGSLTRAELLPHLQDTGATAYSMRRADEFAMAARRSLKCLPNSETKQMLESLTDWSIRREK